MKLFFFFVVPLASRELPNRVMSYQLHFGGFHLYGRNAMEVALVVGWPLTRANPLCFVHFRA